MLIPAGEQLVKTGTLESLHLEGPEKPPEQIHARQLLLFLDVGVIPEGLSWPCSPLQ